MVKSIGGNEYKRMVKRPPIIGSNQNLWLLNEMCAAAHSEAVVCMTEIGTEKIIERKGKKEIESVTFSNFMRNA